MVFELLRQRAVRWQLPLAVTPMWALPLSSSHSSHPSQVPGVDLLFEKEPPTGTLASTLHSKETENGPRLADISGTPNSLAGAMSPDAVNDSVLHDRSPQTSVPASVHSVQYW